MRCGYSIPQCGPPMTSMMPPDDASVRTHEPAQQKQDRLTPQIRGTVEDTLQRLGIDTTQPAEQRADMLYLRRLRKWAEEFNHIEFKVVCSILLSAVLYALWQGIVSRFKS